MNTCCQAILLRAKALTARQAAPSYGVFLAVILLWVEIVALDFQSANAFRPGWRLQTDIYDNEMAFMTHLCT